MTYNMDFPVLRFSFADEATVRRFRGTLHLSDGD